MVLSNALRLDGALWKARGTRARFRAVSTRHVPPAEDLGNRPDTMDLGCFDTTRNEHLEALTLLRPEDGPCRLTGCTREVWPRVVTEKDRFGVWNPEVDGRDAACARTLQFSKPLVRHVEVSSDGHGKDAGRAMRRAPTRADAVSENPGRVRGGRERNEEAQRVPGAA